MTQVEFPLSATNVAQAVAERDAEIERLAEAMATLGSVLQRIWAICHRPSSQHPKGAYAYSHFMADFDEIRALCKPYVKQS